MARLYGITSFEPRNGSVSVIKASIHLRALTRPKPAGETPRSDLAKGRQDTVPDAAPLVYPTSSTRTATPGSSLASGVWADLLPHSEAASASIILGLMREFGYREVSQIYYNLAVRLRAANEKVAIRRLLERFRSVGHRS